MSAVKFKAGSVTFGLERAGVLAPVPMWYVIYGSWLHLDTSLCGVLWSVLWEWKADKHLVGY